MCSMKWNIGRTVDSYWCCLAKLRTVFWHTCVCVCVCVCASFNQNLYIHIANPHIAKEHNAVKAVLDAHAATLSEEQKEIYEDSCKTLHRLQITSYEGMMVAAIVNAGIDKPVAKTSVEAVYKYIKANILKENKLELQKGIQARAALANKWASV